MSRFEHFKNSKNIAAKAAPDQAGSLKVKNNGDRAQPHSYSGFPVSDDLFSFSSPTASNSETQADQIGEQVQHSLQHVNQTFGAALDNVRIHTGSEAIQRAEGLNARAFTYGSDIYFNRGEYNPNTSDGRNLLGHELTHSAQQKGHAPVVQKKDKPPKKEEKKDEASNWFNQMVYDIAKEALGKDALDGYAKLLAESAIEKSFDVGKELIEGQEGASATDILASKSSLLGVGLVLQGVLENSVKGILNSNGGKKFLTGYLKQVKKDPKIALGSLLIGLAILYLTGQEQSKTFGKFKIGGSVGAKGIADPSFKKASLSLGLAFKKFEVGLKGSVELGKEEIGPKEPEKGMVVGVTQDKKAGETEMEPGETVKLGFGPTLNIKDRFKLGVGPTFDSAKGWGGQLALRFGSDKSYFAPSFSLDQSGDLGFKMDFKNPGKLKNLSLKAHLIYNYDEQIIRSVGINSSFTIRRNKPKSILQNLYIGVQIDGRHFPTAQPAIPGQVFRAEGVLFFGGTFR